MIFSVQSRLSYEVEHLTPAWFFLLGAHTDGQRILTETLTTNKPLALHEGWDLVHNRSLYGLLPPGFLELEYQAQVQVSPSGSLTLAPDPVFLHASRYCCPQQVRPLVLDILGQERGEWQMATLLCRWVQQHVCYLPCSTTSRSTAVDTLIRGSGVCRDFAHVAISLCRAAGLPARYVSVYAYQLHPPDFHALFEVFADGQWHLMDATGLADVSHVVRIGMGRDAGDIPVAEFSEKVTCCSLSVVVDLLPEREAVSVPTWVESA
ncbi:MAG: hypothetical protein OHK0012_12870 [Synechococcales cyanobacterium]